MASSPRRRARTALAPSAFAGGGGGGGRGVRTGSAVGEPGKGAAVLSQMQPRRAARRLPPAGAGKAAMLESRRVPFGGVDPVYAVGSDGMLHTLAASNGADQEPPVRVPAAERPAVSADLGGRHRLHEHVERLRRRAQRACGRIDLTDL